MMFLPVLAMISAGVNISTTNVTLGTSDDGSMDIDYGFLAQVGIGIIIGGLVLICFFKLLKHCFEGGGNDREVRLLGN